MHRPLAGFVLAALAASAPDAPAVRGATLPAPGRARVAPHPAAPSCGTAAFGSPRYYPAAVNPYYLASADLDGDGHVDLVTANAGLFGDSPSISVLLGDGLGDFAAAATTPLGNAAPSGGLAVGDVNGDGHVDLLIATFDGDSIAAGLTVVPGDGAGSFGSPAFFPLGAGFAPTSLVAADVDGDGHLDAVLTSVRDDETFAGTLHVLKGDGTGSFGPPANMAIGVYPNDLTLADFNHDGRLDLAVVNYGEEPPPGAVEIRLGDGAGGFGPPVSSHAVRYPYSVVAGDLDEDGDLDLAVVTTPPNQGGTAVVLLGDGAGHLGPPTVFPSAFGAYGLELADVTGDGHLDVVASGHHQQSNLYLVGVFAGDGDGSLGPPTPFPVDGLGPVVADFDHDGRTDVAVSGGQPFTAGHVGVLLSTCGATADLSVSMTDSPDPVVIGNRVTYTLQVTNNGPDPANATAGVRLPPGLGFVSASATAGVCAAQLPADRTVRCLIPELPAAGPGNTATVTVVARANQAGTKTVTGSAFTSSALDSTAANNTATQTTQVTAPGGSDLSITAVPGGAALNWTGGDAQAGYVVGRMAGGVQTRFPPTGMLPPETTSFVDSAAVPGQINCYQVAPMTAEGTGLGLSQMLCVAPDTASPPGALAEFRLRLDPPNNAIDIAWSPFGGQTLYVLRYYKASGNGQSTYGEDATATRIGIHEPTCYVLIPVNGTTPLANSAALCAVPDMGTLGTTSLSSRDLFSSLARAAALLQRIPGGVLR